MKSQDIKSISLIYVNGQQVNTSELGEEERREVGTWLKTTYLNHMYRGRAIFQAKENSPQKKSF